MKENTYTISKEMMNCFKQLLFTSDEKGVNLQGIINDLTLEEENELLACSIAFAYKGIIPQINKSTRFKPDYRCYYAYEIVGYSVIMNSYKCVCQRFYFNKETKEFELVNEERKVQGFPADFINSLSTTLDVSKVKGLEQ